MTGCPFDYAPMTNDNVDLECLNYSCPLPYDIGLQECAAICSRETECSVFKHSRIGPTNACYLHKNISDNKSDSTESPRQSISNCYAIKLGISCCKKGMALI